MLIRTQLSHLMYLAERLIRSNLHAVRCKDAVPPRQETHIARSKLFISMDGYGGRVESILHIQEVHAHSC